MDINPKKPFMGLNVNAELQKNPLNPGFHALAGR